MLLSLCGGGGWVGWGWWCGWGLQSHFRVQPNNCLEVVLRCVVVGVGVVTILSFIIDNMSKMSSDA